MMRLILILIISVMAVSMASILIRWLPSVPSAVIAAYRLIFSTVLFLPLGIFSWRSGQIDSIQSSFPKLLLSGLALAAHFWLWIDSLKRIPVADSVFLVATYPVFTVIHAFITGHDRPHGRTIAGVLLAVVGTFVMMQPSFSPGPIVTGYLEALGASFCAAVYFIAGRQVRPYIGLTLYVSMVYGIGGVVMVVLCLTVNESLIIGHLRDAIILLLLALIPQGVGHTGLNWALRYLSPTMVSLTAMGEPVMATLLAGLLIEEWPTSSTLLGGVLILLGIFLGYKPVNGRVENAEASA